MQNFKMIQIAVFAVITLIAFSGCSTVKGVGQDFEAMGKSIQNAGN